MEYCTLLAGAKWKNNKRCRQTNGQFKSKGDKKID